MTNLTAVSLFSGAGGLDMGFHQAGISTIWANDINDDACSTFSRNLGSGIIRCGSIANYISGFDESWGADILVGGPPCQGFSVAGYMDLNDPRSELVFTYMKALRALRPRAFILENVKALAVLEKFRPIRERLKREAREAGYDVELVVVKSSDFGVPQSRERMLLVGLRDHSVADFLTALESQKVAAPSLRDAIQHLGRAGSASNSRVCKAKITIAKQPVLRASPYAGMLFNGQGRPLDPDGYAATLPASMGGNRTPIIDEDELHGGLTAWVKDYHQQLIQTGKIWTEPEAPKRLRRLTIDEAAAIQTFPSGFKFVGRSSSVYSQIGNAVPCEMASRVAVALQAVLRSNVATTERLAAVA